MEKPIKKDLQDVEKNKNAAALSYIWILCLYGLLFKSKSDFVRFHAKQGTVLFVIEIISPIVLGPLSFIVIFLAILLAFKGVYASLEGKYWYLPWIGSWLHDRT